MMSTVANTRAVGPLEIGTKPYWHWCLHLPSGLRLMRTPLTTILYRVGKPNELRRLPFSHRRKVEHRRVPLEHAASND